MILHQQETIVDYLQPKDEIVVTIDVDLDIPCFQIRAKGWHSARVCLSKNRKKNRWKVNVFMK